MQPKMNFLLSSTTKTLKSVNTMPTNVGVTKGTQTVSKSVSTKATSPMSPKTSASAKMDDKDCLFACVDDTDPCVGDGDCDNSRDFIKDECECKDDDKECLMMCVSDAMDTCNSVCFDQDYECLEPCFQTPRNQLTGKSDRSLRW